MILLYKDTNAMAILYDSDADFFDIFIGVLQGVTLVLY